MDFQSNNKPAKSTKVMFYSMSMHVLTTAAGEKNDENKPIGRYIIIRQPQ